jgi:hypothetical protein
MNALRQSMPHWTSCEMHFSSAFHAFPLILHGRRPLALEYEEWLFVREAAGLIGSRFEHEGQAEQALLRRLAVGTLLAWETGAIRYWQEKDWSDERDIELGKDPIPKEFWEHFLEARDSCRKKGNHAEVEETWETGDFSFSLPIGDICTYKGFAHGVLVHRSGIADILGEKRQPGPRGADSKPLIPVPDATEAGALSGQIASRRGRVPIYDWTGALAHVAALAHSSDGLFLESGAEPSASHIARLMEAWFIGKNQKAPADSELRKHATKVLVEINALKLLSADKSEQGF